MKASKVGTRAKPVKKTAAKPAKKRSKSLSAGKRERFIKQPAEVIARLPKPRPQKVSLAEVEIVAAAAIKKIKASRKLSPDEKAFRLADVADSLERARGWGGLSRAGVSIMKHAHEPSGWCDLEAVLA